MCQLWARCSVKSFSTVSLNLRMMYRVSIMILFSVDELEAEPVCAYEGTSVSLGSGL